MANAIARAAITAAAAASMLAPAPALANTRAGESAAYRNAVTAHRFAQQPTQRKKGGFAWDGWDGATILLQVGLVAAVFTRFMEDGSLFGGSSRTGQGNDGGGFRSNGAG